MKNQIQKHQQSTYLLRSKDSRTVRNRLQTFLDYCNEEGIDWLQADLGVYRDHLLEDLSANSVSAHLSTLRGRIRQTLVDNNFVKSLYALFSEQGLSFEQSHLRVEALLTQIKNMADPINSSVKVLKKQDLSDSQRRWLTPEQEEDLLVKIVYNKPELLALRDQAIIALLLTTGLRAQELCDLFVEDLYAHYQRKPALLVREGKGNKQRLILYGDLIYGRDELVAPWVKSARLHDKDPLFQGFWKGYKKLRGRHLNTWTVQELLRQVHIFDEHEGHIQITPHDLRRTYARKLYMPPFNMRIEWIQRQMGHTSQAVTESYIGEPDVDLRVPTRKNTDNRISDNRYETRTPGK